MEKAKSGFTLLEVVLVVAISTLLFMSVVIGIGSRIATGRYETASTEIADYLRDVYTVALNTENAREGIEGAREYCTIYGATNLSETATPKTGKQLFTNNTVNSSNVTAEDVEPGRTNCAIYGKALYFGAKDGKVHVFDVVGDVVTNDLKKMIVDGKEVETTELKQIESKPDILDQLEYVRADIFAAIPDTSNGSNLSNIFGNSCKISPAGAHTVYEPNWGALFKTANFDENMSGNFSRDNGDDFVGMVMIVRAPASGNVHTFFYEYPGRNNNADIWQFIDYFDSPNNMYGHTCGTINKGPGEYEDFVDKYSPVQLIKRQNEDADNNVYPAPEYTGFCIGSDDFYVSISNLKKYVEFIPGGQNASAVKLNESTDKEGGNPCHG